MNYLKIPRESEIYLNISLQIRFQEFEAETSGDLCN